MNLSEILKEVGNEGLFQILTLIALTMPKMPIQWSMTMMSFASFTPEWCCVPQDVTVDGDCETMAMPNSTVISYKSSYQHCDLNATLCDHRIYLAQDGASTAVTEWDLVCDRNWIVSFLSSIQMGGVMVGSLVSGFMSELFGRKKVHFASIFLHAVCNVIAGFSTSWIMFAILRFFIGFCIGGFLVVHVPYALEFISARWRVIPASLPFSAIGASLLPLAAWSLPDWRWMHFACALFCSPFLLAYFFLPESMRWLTVKGRVKEAAKVLETIAKINGKQDYDHEKCLKKIQTLAQKEKELVEKGKKYTYLDVYRGWPMARLTLTQQFVWFTTSLVGYGIILGITNLAGNIYLNMFLVEVVEIPFIMVTCYFNNCIGRRLTALIYFSFATIAGLLALIFQLVPDLPYKDTGITVMCICCRSFIAGAAAVFIVVSTEVYPTVIRTLGYGAANTAAKVGGVLAPFIINIETIPTVAYSVIAATCFLCIVAVWSLEETKNLLMEDTLQKSSSRQSLTTSRSYSYDKTDGQSKVIIDFDTDLIHHKSYSEYDDDSQDDEEGQGQDTRDFQVDENLPLLRQRFPMYKPKNSSGELEVTLTNNGFDLADLPLPGGSSSEQEVLNISQEVDNDLRRPGQGLFQLTVSNEVNNKGTQTSLQGEVVMDNSHSKNSDLNTKFVREY